MPSVYERQLRSDVPEYPTGRPMTSRDAYRVMLGMIISLFVSVPLLAVLAVLAYDADGLGAVAVLFVGLYVFLNWLVEPSRPPWEPSLFPDHVAARIRRRRFLNPLRGEED